MMIVSGTEKEILNSLMENYHYSIEDIAYAINSNPKTLSEILQGHATLPKTSLRLLIFYLQIKIIEEINPEAKRPVSLMDKKPLTLKENRQLILTAGNKP